MKQMIKSKKEMKMDRFTDKVMALIGMVLMSVLLNTYYYDMLSGMLYALTNAVIIGGVSIGFTVVRREYKLRKKYNIVN